MLGDIDDDTFVRFSQYAYTGDYVAADPEILLGSSAIATTHQALDDASPNRVGYDGGEAPAPAIDGAEPVAVNIEVESAAPEPDFVVADTPWDPPNGISFSSKDKKKKKKRAGQYNHMEEPEDVAVPEEFTPQTKKSNLWQAFKSKAHTTSGPDFQPQRNREPCENYTEVFLCHARLYVFADKYDIGPLRRLSLHKLQRTLVKFTLYDERVGDIVNLMRYSYSNTADCVGYIDDLRLLVVHYAACVVEDLAQSLGFQSLLEEAGSLARDLVEQMVSRLN